MSEKLQYIIIGIIFAACGIWIGIRLYRLIKRKNSGCCGCSLQDACGKNRKHQESSCCCNDKTPTK